MRIVSSSIILALASSAFAAPTTQPTTPQSQENLEVRQSIRYLQYLPQGYADDPANTKDGGHGWPLVLFLHGAGERGTDLEKVNATGLPKLIADGKEYPFIVLSPQVDPEQWWSSPELLKLIDHAENTLHVDKDRIYVTGLSMGGFGTWNLAQFAQGRLAAIAPICGGGFPALSKFVPSMKTLPIWAFHGDADNIVPISETREMVDSVTALGNPNVKFTIYPGVGHDSWTKTYANPEFYEWLLAQRRGKPAARGK